MTVLNPFKPKTSESLVLLGLFLIAFSAYSLLSPGRIDMIDGQWRYEVASSLAFYQQPIVTDPILQRSVPEAKNGKRYGKYGLSGSVLGVPLIFVAEFLDGGNVEFRQFMYSLLSPLLSALGLIVFYKILRLFGNSVQKSLCVTGLLGFTSLYFHVATTVFDQGQNTLFLLLAFYFGLRYNQTKRCKHAFLGALSFFILINFKSAYIVFLPGFLFLSGITSLEKLETHLLKNKMAIAFLGFTGVSLLFGSLVNLYLYGNFTPPSSPNHPPTFDNPVLGLLVLILSPGKSIFLYSPIIVLALLGWRRFYHADRFNATAVLTLILPYIILIASLSFVGGDWSWGPRYLVLIIPFVMLAFTHLSLKGLNKALLVGVIGASFGIQLLSLTMDHHRFFYERNLPAFFWYKNSDFYFKESALFSRIEELQKLENPWAGYSRPFVPSPHPELDTYCVFGPAFEKPAKWVEKYPVFSFPRPWPLWTVSTPNEEIERFREPVLYTLLIVFLSGLAIMLLAAGSNGERSILVSKFSCREY